LLEHLELRRLFSVYYHYDIVAQSAATSRDLARGHRSITTAWWRFVGKHTVGDAVFSQLPGAAPVNLSPSFDNDSSRTFGNTCRSTTWARDLAGAAGGRDSAQFSFAVQHRFSGLCITVRQRGQWWDRRLRCGLSISIINNSGAVAYGVLASGNAIDRDGQQHGWLYDVPDAGVLQPMVADNGNIVVRAGSSVNSPIRLFDSSLGFIGNIADTANFASIGSAPGISDDGETVVFSGDLTTAGAATLNGNAVQIGQPPLRPDRAFSRRSIRHWGASSSASPGLQATTSSIRRAVHR